MKELRKIITPFLMGERRDGLGRVRDLDPSWEILSVPGFGEKKLAGPDEKIQRMGQIYTHLTQQVQRATEDGALPVSLAGDCVSSLGVLAGLQRANAQPDRILWLDAHGDFHTWESTQTNYIGGMPLAMLVGRGDQRVAEAVGLKPFAENRIVLSDARDLDQGEEEALRGSDIAVCSLTEIHKHLSAGERVYLHWDTDVVNDKREMPALKYHVSPGPDHSEICALFRSLAGTNIVAVSVSAWHEEQDPDDKTARASLKALSELGIPTNID